MSEARITLAADLVNELVTGQQQVKGLWVYRALWDQGPAQAIARIAAALTEEILTEEIVPNQADIILTAACELFRALAPQGLSWGDWLLQAILNDDNPWTQAATRLPFDQIPAPLQAAAQQDLRVLQRWWRLEGKLWGVAEKVVEAALGQPLIRWPSSLKERCAGEMCEWGERFGQQADWGDLVPALAAHYRQQGVGLWGQHWLLRWEQGEFCGLGQPRGVGAPLYGLERQQAAVDRNTQALVAGRPALHVLLYGARGTGKSSLIKTLVPRFGPQGLRLVSLGTGQLGELRSLVTALTVVPQPVVILLDDLSFEPEETSFKTLKALLEGEGTTLPAHIRVYATSNRRHLRKELRGDRPNPSDSEVHAWDTVQETLSLGDRFGLTLTFPPMLQADYLATVAHLVAYYQLPLTSEMVRAEAIRWAQQQNGFSGRTAQQLVDYWRGEFG